MKTKVLIAILSLFFLAACSTLAAPEVKALAPIRLVLVGDSTMAVRSGWGPGFAELLRPEVTCTNMAKGGRSSGSYRAEGSWDKVMEELRRKDNFKETYVLIQFGHNDQPGKPGRSTDLATEFPVNMRRYVKEVKEAGAKPVLLTPLTRRSFKDGWVRNELSAWADATRKVGREEGVPVLELNRDSVEAVQKMGPAEANTLAMAPPPVVKEGAAEATNSKTTNAMPANNKVEKQGDAASKFDYTHLGKKGSSYFGRMVTDELTTAIPELKSYFKR